MKSWAVASRSMDNVKNDRYYVALIVDDIEKILRYAKQADFSEEGKDTETMDAISFRLGQIREAIKGLTPSFIAAHPAIDFSTIVFMRNKVTHDYQNVDFSAYHALILQDFPKIKRQLEKYWE